MTTGRHDVAERVRDRETPQDRRELDEREIALLDGCWRAADPAIHDWVWPY
jgi:hypothetical protein